MKIIFLLSLLSLSALAMQQQGRPYPLYPKDRDGNVMLANGQVESYDRFFSKFEKSATFDDTKKGVKISQSLFIQLCVQASKAKNNQVPFQELLAKIRAGVVNVHAESVFITQKDAHYRLLSYIARGEVNSLVNNKKYQIIVTGYETEEDRAHNASLRAHAANHTFELGMGYRPIGNWKQSGQEIATINHEPTEDKAHHDAVVAEFNTLVKG